MMVGFPGELDSDFKESMDIIKRVRFLKVHVFPYSVRPGTLAANMTDKISNKVKMFRVKMLINEAGIQTKNTLEEYIGKKVNVLYESVKNNEFYEGYTPNYILVRTKSCVDLKGEIIPTVIDNVYGDYCVGRTV